MSLRPPSARPKTVPARRSARRSTRIKRASAGLSRVRAGAGLAVLGSAAVTYGLGSSPAFGMDAIEVAQTRFTTPELIRRTVGTAPGTNLFTIETDPLEQRLESLPAVRGADVAVVLPDRLVVNVEEREPILVWQAGDRRLLVDVEGRIFGELGSSDRAADAAADGLPVVTDSRTAAANLRAPGQLDPIDLDAARRLASVTPIDVGSSARAFRLTVSDQNGFVLRTGEGGWIAIFGFYTPTLRTTEMIPEQVRTLRSLLAGRERDVERVILSGAREGTYVSRPTPRPTATPRPTRRP